MLSSDSQEAIQRAFETVLDSGKAIVSGFVPEHGERLLDALADHVGTCIHHPDQPRIMAIKPTRNCGQKSFGGTSEFPLHTDMAWAARPPRYLAMFCVHPGEDDGHATYADSFRVVAEGSAADRRAWEQDRVFFPAPGHVQRAGTEGHAGPILDADLGPGACRFNTRDIWDDLSEAARRFADGLEAVMETVPLQAGDLMLYDNWRYCHGRTAIGHAAESRRHLLRMYIDPR